MLETNHSPGFGPDSVKPVTNPGVLRLKSLESSVTIDPGAAAAPDASAALLDRVRQRDEPAARELVDQLYPVIAPVVYANLPRREDPGDLMQDIFLKVFSRLEQYRGEVPLAHWVRRIALTTCFDRLRRQKVRPEFLWNDLPENEQAALAAAHAPDHSPDPDATDALDLLNRLLERLPAQEAWLLRRVELEGRNIAEVCDETGWNSGAARVRLFRARLKLKKEFRKLESGSNG
jgi:RNA polymerase sigma-70 factor (ECF subfamily)